MKMLAIYYVIDFWIHQLCMSVLTISLMSKLAMHHNSHLDSPMHMSIWQEEFPMCPSYPTNVGQATYSWSYSNNFIPMARSGGTVELPHVALAIVICPRQGCPVDPLVPLNIVNLTCPPLKTELNLWLLCLFSPVTLVLVACRKVYCTCLRVSTT